MVLGRFSSLWLTCGDSEPLASLKVLRDIAIRTTNRSDAGIALVCRHFLEQLSVCLWRHNSHMFLHHFSLLPVGPLWELSPAVDSPAHGLATLSHTACNYIFLVVSATLCHQVNFIITFNAWLFLVVFSTCTLSYQVTFFHGFMFNHSWWFLPYLATRIWHQSSTCMNHKCQRIKLMWRGSLTALAN